MGRLIKNTTVKVDGQAGPLGKGVPMSKAAGPGGIAMMGSSKNPQVPGFKELMARKIAALKDRKMSQSPWGRMLGKMNPEQEGKIRTRMDQVMGQGKNRYGLFSGVLNKMGNQKPGGSPWGGFSNTGPAQLTPNSTPTQLTPANPTGGLVNKTVADKQPFSL